MSEYLKKQLSDKIESIKTDGKVPIIFLLVGTFPGFSNIHQTPPVLCQMIKNERFSPIVILFDSVYKRNIESLEFLKDEKSPKEESVIEGKWYYPDTIPILNDSYHKKVAYQFYSIEVDNDNMGELVKHISPNLTLLWSFTGQTFCNEIEINYFKCQIPEGDCGADIYYQAEYYPQIECDIKNGLGYYFKNFSTSIDDFIKDLKITKDEKVKDQLSGFIYHFLIKWYDEFKTYRSWELQIRLNDPTQQITFTQLSNEQEWQHLIYRAGCYINVKTLITHFKKSGFYTLEEFINQEIFNLGLNLIEFDFINYDEEEITRNKDIFIDEYLFFIETRKVEFPQIFQRILDKLFRVKNPLGLFTEKVF